MIVRVCIILCSELNSTRGRKTEEIEEYNETDTQVCAYIINTEEIIFCIYRILINTDYLLKIFKNNLKVEIL